MNYQSKYLLYKIIGVLYEVNMIKSAPPNGGALLLPNQFVLSLKKI